MSKRLLMVEDNEIHRWLTEEFFEHRGDRVLGLPDGTELIESIASFQPDLILLDLQLPGEDGFCLLERLRQSQWNLIPVIIVSAHGLDREKQRAKSLGISRYLTKPVKLEVLAQAIDLELSSHLSDSVCPVHPPTGSETRQQLDSSHCSLQ